MKFKTRRVINRLAVPITRRCNRSCPECPAHSEEEGSDMTREELQWVGECMGPLGHIEISGGEPTIHEDFEWIAEHIHEIFQCDDILILTNAMVPEGRKKYLLKFDRVYITDYTETFAQKHGTPSNTKEAYALRDWLVENGMHPDNIWIQKLDAHFRKASRQAWANGCIFFYDDKDMVTYYRGQLYGCCTCWQLPYRGKGIVLSQNWRDDLKHIELPCNQCFLGATVEGAYGWN